MYLIPFNWLGIVLHPPHANSMQDSGTLHKEKTPMEYLLCSQSI